MSIYCLVLMILISTSNVLDATKLISNEESQGITNGKPISIDRVPWQISMLKNGEHFCGGSIWSSEYIITSAHCLWNLTVPELAVRAGSTYWDSDGQFELVADIQVHESFTRTRNNNDIAVMRLLQSLELGPNVKTISLATERPRTGSGAFVSGWGKFHINETTITKELHGANVNIMDQKYCKLSLKSVEELTGDMICASGDNLDACKRDTGGPLVSDGVLIGVVTRGFGCGKPGVPGIYADITYFYDWILNTIKEIENRK